MKSMNKELSILLRLGALCLIVAAVFSIANDRTLLGITEFFAAEAGILAIRRFSGNEKENEKKQEQNVMTVIGSISVLLSLMGVGSILNHILNTGESLVQPVCITVFGAAAAWISFRNRGWGVDNKGKDFI